MTDDFKPAEDATIDAAPLVEEAPEEKMKRLVKAEQDRFPRMPPRYVGFTVKHKRFWILLNLFLLFASAGMAVGSVKILGRDREQKSVTYQNCISMEVVCWALFSLHLVNAIFSTMALFGLEKRLCVNYVMLALLIYDLIVLIWAHTTYFQSQGVNCNIEMPDVYFWLMGEILFFYCLTIGVLCYFVRKFCQDPALI